MDRTTTSTTTRTPPEPGRRRPPLALVVTLVLVALLVGVTVTAIALALRDRSTAAGTDPAVVVRQEFAGAPPEGGDVTGGIPAGGTGDVVVTLYEDFLCPACRQLEEVSGDYLDELAAGPDVTVEYRPVAILDRLSAGSEYSTRSAAAAVCVAEEEGEDGFRAFVDALFAAQPAEGTAGPDDAALAELARSTGAGEESAACISEGRFTGWVQRSTQQAQELGVTGTPTVWVDGVPTQARTPEELAAAVAEAAGR